MTHVTADVVMESSTTTGTGPLTLAGAITGYRTFASVMTSPSDTCYYAIAEVDANGIRTGPFEIGKGTYSAANTLTRTTVLASSNAGAAVNFSAGTKQVWIDAPATVLQNLAGNGQIAFPATQNASADANTLDDYEEGSFTPTITSSGGGTPTYTTQVGRYTKIGNRVMFSARVDLATVGSLAAGDVSMAGLPFATQNTAGLSHSFAVFAANLAATAATQVQTIAVHNSSTVALQKYAAGAATALQVSEITGTAIFVISGSYAT